MFEEIWDRKNLRRFSATQICSDWCLTLVFFLSIHFGLQGLSKITFGDLGLTCEIIHLVSFVTSSPVRGKNLGQANWGQLDEGPSKQCQGGQGWIPTLRGERGGH